MTFDYERIRGTAERLLSRFGQPVTLIKPGEPTGPEWAPVPGEPVEYTVTAVDENNMQRDQVGTLIGDAIHALTISTSAGVAPERADRVRVMGREYEITEVAPLAPGGTVLLWQVKLGG